jgi:hypothetical protein
MLHFLRVSHRKWTVALSKYDLNISIRVVITLYSDGLWAGMRGLDFRQVLGIFFFHSIQTPVWKAENTA